MAPYSIFLQTVPSMMWLFASKATQLSAEIPIESRLGLLATTRAAVLRPLRLTRCSRESHIKTSSILRALCFQAGAPGRCCMLRVQADLLSLCTRREKHSAYLQNKSLVPLIWLVSIDVIVAVRAWCAASVAARTIIGLQTYLAGLSRLIIRHSNRQQTWLSSRAG